MQRQAGEVLHGGHLHKPVYQDVPTEAERERKVQIEDHMHSKKWKFVKIQI